MTWPHAEAVENGVKIARNYTGRQNVIAFDVRAGLGLGACSGVLAGRRRVRGAGA